MTENANDNPIKLRATFKEAINFINKNILWVSILGFIITLLMLLSDKFMEQVGTDDFLQIIKYKSLLLVNVVFVYPFLFGSVALLFAEQLLGKKVIWQQTLRKTIKKSIPLILLHVFLCISTLIGFLLFAIPGLVLVSATACALPAIIIEDLSPMEAFKRSWNLTKGSRLRILGYGFLTNMSTLVVAIIVMACFMVSDDNIYYQIIAIALVISPLQALWPVVSTILYFDLRAQKTAIGLEQHRVDAAKA